MTRFDTPRKDVWPPDLARVSQNVAFCRIRKKNLAPGVLERARPGVSENVPDCPTRKNSLTSDRPGHLLLGPNGPGVRVALQEVALAGQGVLGRPEVDVPHPPAAVLLAHVE